MKSAGNARAIHLSAHFQCVLPGKVKRASIVRLLPLQAARPPASVGEIVATIYLRRKCKRLLSLREDVNVKDLVAQRGREKRRIAKDGLDRKSTRLNSSHGYISYAVFCLKKKTTAMTTSCTRPTA